MVFSFFLLPQCSQVRANQLTVHFLGCCFLYAGEEVISSPSCSPVLACGSLSSIRHLKAILSNYRLELNFSCRTPVQRKRCINEHTDGILQPCYLQNSFFRIPVIKGAQQQERCLLLGILSGNAQIYLQTVYHSLYWEGKHTLSKIFEIIVLKSDIRNINARCHTVNCIMLLGWHWNHDLWWW